MKKKTDINKALFTAREYQLKFPEKLFIIGVQGHFFNPETEICEEFSFYYAHNNIIYQCDNAYKTPNNDIDFVREYKVYNLLNIYPEAEYIEIPLNENVKINDDDKIFSKYFCKIPVFKKLHQNLLNPQGRLILHLDNYYIENSELFFDAGFEQYGQYFYDYLEENFEPNLIFLRKSYVRFLKNNNLNKALEKLMKIEKLFVLNEFDLSNFGYIYKMKEEFKKACYYYKKIDFSKKQNEYLFNDYLYCLEMTSDIGEFKRIKNLKEKFYSGE
ncbi:MAG: hypothetical protein ACQESP_10000 [Candidatus Muiribacteriota bacterium]